MPAASRRCSSSKAIGSAGAGVGQAQSDRSAIAGRQQTASLEEERANSVVAKAEWERAQQGGDLFSKEENERRRCPPPTAEAKVKAAEAQVADARYDWRSTIIRRAH